MTELVTVWNGERDRYLCVQPVPPPVPIEPVILPRRSICVTAVVLEALPICPGEAISPAEIARRVRITSAKSVWVILGRNHHRVQWRIQGSRRVYWRREKEAE